MAKPEKSSAEVSMSIDKILRFMVKYNIFFILLILFLAASILTPRFFSLGNQINIIRQIAIIGMLGAGLTVVLIGKGIDLSVGGTVALAGVIVALYQDQSLPVIILLTVAAGAFVGLLNGIVIVKGRIQGFIVTLAMGSIAQGAAYLLTDGKPIYIDHAAVTYLTAGTVFGIPVPALILIVTTVLITFLLRSTVFGYNLYAIGGNEEAALLSGINTSFYKISSYVFNGAMAGLAGLLMASRISMGQPNISGTIVLDAIAPVLIGGTSLSGGTGTMVGTFIGVFIIGIINNMCNLLNISTYWQMVIKGIIVIAAIFMSRKPFQK